MTQQDTATNLHTHTSAPAADPGRERDGAAGVLGFVEGVHVRQGAPRPAALIACTVLVPFQGVIQISYWSD